MKIKELPQGTNLRGIRFRVPGDKRVHTWYSQWSKGIWCSGRGTNVYPLFIEDLKESLEYEVVE